MSAAPVLAVVLVVVVARPWRPRSSGRPKWSGRASAGRVPGLVDVASARWLVPLLVGAAALVLGGPASAVVLGAGAALAPMAVRRLVARRQAAAVTAAVPDLVDLFVVAASAGQPVAGSLAVVGPRSPVAVAPFVSAADERFRRGLPLADSLIELGADLGPAGVPLADALRQAASAGVPLVPLLEGVAVSARDARRRRAQEVARRLPVTMLFPLVACILPAAVLLAVVPVLLVSIASLSP